MPVNSSATGSRWAPVKGCTVQTRKAFKLIKLPLLLKRLSIKLNSGMRCVDPGTPARCLFRLYRMRGTVGSEKEFRIAARGGLEQSLSIALALKHRQTV